jgi:hypothetical protein
MIWQSYFPPAIRKRVKCALAAAEEAVAAEAAVAVETVTAAVAAVPADGD